MFGPLVAFGPGGVYAELIGSTRFALAPLGEIDVEELVSSGKAAKLVDGWRGAPPADRAAVIDVIHRLGRLAEDFPEVAELDLNPVLARPGRMRRGRCSRAPSPPACGDDLEDLVNEPRWAGPSGGLGPTCKVMRCQTAAASG